ncbi:MAG: hypothetical protein LBS89_05630, partial [Zoogloeaceae bacterium]|nr:hypothetical protein [Zoogloeaceae bacterium]
WKSLLASVKIDFAYRTFKWSNEAKGKAAVHCVIIGFSAKSLTPVRFIIDGEDRTEVKNINPYLVNAPDVLMTSQKAPVCDAPKMSYGSMPIDEGALILSEEEKTQLESADQKAMKFLRKYIGGEELINNRVRWCLWLKDASSSEMRASKFILARIDRCKKFRSQSNRPQTKELAGTSHLFGEIRQPDSTMLVLPKVSSENRNYLPIGFVSPEVIVNGSALIVPDASTYHFGILSSSVHNHWMRAICGRMKSDYQYSIHIVYNNFPWPEATDQQKTAIEKAAKAVLTVREKSPDSNLADLYDPRTMPPELLKAHKTLDKVVMQAYGFSLKASEAEIVAALMERYQALIGKGG